LIWNLKTAIEQHKSVGDLIAIITEIGKLDPNLQLTFVCAGSKLGREKLLVHYAGVKSLVLNYPAPPDPTTQRFILPVKSGRSVLLRIGRELSVREVKLTLLAEAKRRDVLASGISLQFFDCDFVDSDLFWTYGVPDNSSIYVFDISENFSEIQVGIGRTVETFRFSDNDTVNDLTFAIRWRRGPESRSFTLISHSRALDDTELLSSLDGHSIELFELFTFRSAKESVSLPIREEATLDCGRSALASHLGIDPIRIQFLSGICVIEDFSNNIWSNGESIEFSLSERRQTFLFEGRRLDLTVDFNLPFSELQTSLCREFGITSPISIFFDDSEVDPDMTLKDLELNADQSLRIELSVPSEPSTPRPAIPPPSSPPEPAIASASASAASPAVAVVTYSIVLILGIVSRVGSYVFAPTATLTEVEAAVRQRFDLGDLELEFGLLDINTDETTIIAKSTEIGRLDLHTFSLIVRPSESCARPEEPTSASADCGGVGGADGDAGSEVLMRSLDISCGSVRDDIPVYRFVCSQRSDEFELRLAIGTKVSSATEMIGHRYSVPTAAVTLLFRGRILSPSCMMERLRVGASRIDIDLRDDREILLMSAKANCS
jgi:hypothetical protein